MLVIDDEDIVKVHIHTNHPGFVLEEAVKIGEMINLKIDNMKHQHNSIISDAPQSEKKDGQKPSEVITDKEAKAKAELKEVGFVAVGAGKGFVKILKDLGADKVIEGGQTMNPSTEDILKAASKVKAKTVFVFPNNKNIILAANQAAELIEDKRIIVIPTKNIPQCISAITAYNDKLDCETNEKAMSRAAEKVRSGQITYAVRDTEIDGREIKKDDILGISASDISVVGENAEDVLMKLTDSLIDEDTEFITIYFGKDVKKAQAEKIARAIEEKYADDEIEVSLKMGGQPVYYYVVGIE